MEINDKLKIFKEGIILIFKKWSSFRLALDNCPEVLDEYDDDGQLEINSMLEALMNDIMGEIVKEKGQTIERNIGDLLVAFIQEYFEVDIEDESEKSVAKDIVKLFLNLNENKTELLDKLIAMDKTYSYSQYEIKFPIEDTSDSDDMLVDEEGSNPNTNEAEDVVKLIVESKPIHKNEPEVDEEGFTIVKKKKKY